jgi:nitrate reductase NapAB chaperone NapD
VLTVEALERLLFEEFVAAVIQIHNPSALEDINQALNALAENQRRDHLEDVLANYSVIELYKRYQEFKEDSTVLNKFIAKIWLVLRFMKATKEKDLDLYITTLQNVLQLFFVYYHQNYQTYKSVYVFRLIN